MSRVVARRTPKFYDGTNMTPLDLRLRPPREPTAALDGLLFLPRTIDKARAVLKGGNLGAYAMHGFSEMMLGTIAVAPSAFVDAVRAAETDDDVVRWLREHALTSAYPGWNEWLLSRMIVDEAHRARVELIYPVARDPGLSRIVDVLAADDRERFGDRADGERVAS